MCHFVWLAAAGVGVLFTREFSTGDKLSRQLGATVARLIGSIDAMGWLAGGRAISARDSRYNSPATEARWVNRPALCAGQSSMSSTMSSRDVMTSGGPAETITLLVAEQRACESETQSYAQRTSIRRRRRDIERRTDEYRHADSFQVMFDRFPNAFIPLNVIAFCRVSAPMRARCNYSQSIIQASITFARSHGNSKRITALYSVRGYYHTRLRTCSNKLTVTLL